MLRPLKWRIFLETEIGQIYQVLPLSELATLFPYKKSPHPQGVKGFFDVQGGMALQVLKHHSGMSDEQVVAHLNGNWHWQYFCGIELSLFKQIKDVDMVGRWRRYLASFNKGQTWESAQKVLAKAWQGDMKDIAPLSMQMLSCCGTVRSGYLSELRKRVRVAICRCHDLRSTANKPLRN